MAQSISQIVTSVFDKAVYAYLQSNYTLAGQAIHEAVILGIAATEGLSRSYRVDWAARAVIPVTQVNDVLDFIDQTLIDPNLEGIPIRTEQYTVGREVDVSESATIYQAGYTKAYNIHNSIPHLRTFQIRGYISTLMASFGIDYGHTLKPSVMLQAQYLDALSTSSLPCMFKTPDNEFVPVLVKAYQLTQDPRALNARSIQLQLVEFKPIETKIKLQDILSGVKIT